MFLYPNGWNLDGTCSTLRVWRPAATTNFDQHQLWSDLGSWASLHDNSKRDEHNNSIDADAMTYDTRNSVIKGPEDKLIVVQGLNGYLVGAFDNVVIVCEKDKEELFRRFVTDLKAKSNGTDYL